MIAFADAFPLGEVTGKFPFTANGRRLVTTSEFAYHDTVDGHALDVTIPVGFESDFNSTPRFIWGYFPPWECPEAGLIHDYLYQYPGRLSRKEIDAVHRTIMQLKGERKSKAYVAWLGIRAGGWKPWDAYRARDAAGLTK